MIHAKELRKTYGKGASEVRALRDVTLQIGRGEMVAVMGPSGCGKTTLLQVLAGIEPADRGETWIDGTPLHTLKDKRLSKFRLEKMGFVFQQYHLIDVLSVLENTALPLIARGVPAKEAKAKASAALERVGLADKASALPSELSGGQCQRAAIARAIVGEPQVIWADEPTGALDSGNAEQVIGLMCKLNESLGTTVIVVTHDPAVAAKAHRILRMDNGRIVGEGGPAHV
ncbi:ABC transporter ATP-binding protein [Paenibacillus thermotolerans]|uniref:ABC transporter ATP-binding protein n=1 Tax=Paenibacillus thermotolerans TaxID=3027807 RepID=UPI0023684589|nr:MULTISPECIES: ABC transporter ATP-binding protein [unclassified Paenibacillus]